MSVLKVCDKVLTRLITKQSTNLFSIQIYGQYQCATPGDKPHSVAPAYI